MSAVQSIAVPPHNLEAEKSVLGAVLLDERHLHALLVEEQLRPEHFYREAHGAVFAAMVGLYESDSKIDHLTIAERLRESGKLDEVGGPAAIEELAGWVPAAGHAREYGRIVHDNAQLRALLTASYEIQARVLAREAPARELVEQAERSVLEVATDERQKRIRSISDILHEETDKLHRLSVAKTALTGTPAGFRDLDEKTGGFQPGNLVVIAARPSMGKSALVANIAENAALDGHAVALFSLEMSESELAQRFVASQANLKGEDLRRGRLPERQWPAILEACDRLARARLFVDDSSDTGVLEVRAKSRRLHAQVDGGLGLIIIDYLQLMRHEGRIESRVEQVGQISRGLKGLARELNVPVIALSQLSRAVEQRGGEKKPILSDLRECVTGDTLVALADGRRVPIGELVGTAPEIVALDAANRIVTARSEAVWPVGIRRVVTLRLASGRTLRGTEDHRVLTGRGWTRLGELRSSDRVALARRLPEPGTPVVWPDARVALLGQLIGDGRHRWRPRRVRAWLKELGIFGHRPEHRRVPAAAFQLADRQIALLLRNLWAADGRIWAGAVASNRLAVRIYYATASPELASDVAALLLRLGIVARIGTATSHGRTMFSVNVSGSNDQRLFLATVGACGPQVAGARAAAMLLPDAGASTGAHAEAMLLPDAGANAGARAEAMLPPDAGADSPELRATAHADSPELRGTARGGAPHLRTAPSHAPVTSPAEAQPERPYDPAGQDVCWDAVLAVEPSGEDQVFDLTVPGPACWVADGVVTHNSGQIEQDADLVMFIYRDEYYDNESERPGEADIIIAKHRNGPIGDVVLTFRKEVPKFANYAGDRFRE